MSCYISKSFLSLSNFSISNSKITFLLTYFVQYPRFQFCIKWGYLVVCFVFFLCCILKFLELHYLSSDSFWMLFNCLHYSTLPYEEHAYMHVCDCVWHWRYRDALTAEDQATLFNHVSPEGCCRRLRSCNIARSFILH